MTSEVVLCAISVCNPSLILSEVKKGKRKRWWTRNLFAGGVRVGLNLLEKLKLEDVMGFTNFTRTTPSDFEELLQMFRGKISKCDIRFRKKILPQSDSHPPVSWQWRIIANPHVNF
jgi:hypothetical protein